MGCQEKENKNKTTHKHICPVTYVMLLGYHAFVAFEKYKYLTCVVSEIQSLKKVEFS